MDKQILRFAQDDRGDIDAKTGNRQRGPIFMSWGAGGRAAFRRSPGRCVSRIRNKLSSLLVDPLDDALNCVDLALLEVRLTTLVTDPSRDRVEYQVIAVAVDVEGCLRALHLPMTVDTVHIILFARPVSWMSTASSGVCLLRRHCQAPAGRTCLATSTPRSRSIRAMSYWLWSSSQKRGRLPK